MYLFFGAALEFRGHAFVFVAALEVQGLVLVFGADKKPWDTFLFSDLH